MQMWVGETKEIPFRVQGVNPTNGSPVDPTTADLTVGFSRSEPNGEQVRPNNYYPGTWDSTPTGEHWGSIIVGPDADVTLQAGRWTVWANFTLGAETIIEPIPDVLVVR